MEGKYDNKQKLIKNKLISLGLSLRGEYGNNIWIIKISKIFIKKRMELLVF